MVATAALDQTTAVWVLQPRAAALESSRRPPTALDLQRQAARHLAQALAQQEQLETMPQQERLLLLLESPMPLAVSILILLAR